MTKMTPRKRKRDGRITEYFPITPKTPRTRDMDVGTDSDDDMYELSDRESSPSRRRGRYPHPRLQPKNMLSIASRLQPDPIAATIQCSFTLTRTTLTLSV